MMTKIAIVALLMSLVTVTIGLSIEKQAQANILHDLGDGVDNLAQGRRDGIDAGARGDSYDCPSDSKAYCVGWPILFIFWKHYSSQDYGMLFFLFFFYVGVGNSVDKKKT